MATLSVVAINNKVVTTFTKQFNYDQVVFGPVAFVYANHPPHEATTGLAYFTYDEGLGRPTKYVVSDSLATTRSYFLAAGTLATTAVATTVDTSPVRVGTYSTAVVDTATVPTVQMGAHVAIATAKDTAGDGVVAGAFLADATHATLSVHASMEAVRAITTLHGNVTTAYGVNASLVIHDAVNAHASNGLLSAVYGITTITGAVTQGWVTSGYFEVTGAGGVTELNHGVVIKSASSVTSLDAMLYLSNAGNATKGVDFVGDFNKGLDFSGATLNYAAYSSAGTGSRNKAFIGIGTWDAPVTFTNASDHFVPFQVNIKNNGNVAFDFAAARLRVDTAAACALTSHNVLELRAKVAHNVAASAVVQASAEYSAAVAITTGEVAIGYFSLDGTGAITLPGSNCASAIIGSVTNTGTFVGTANIAYLRTAASTAIVNGILMSNLGTMTNAIHLTTDAAITNLIKIAAVTNVTNFINFDSAAGCVVTNALVPATAPVAGTVGADAAIKVLIGATPYYIPLYDTLHA